MEEIKEEELKMFHKRKRKRHKIVLAILTVICMLISIVSIMFYYVLNTKSSILYNETSNIDYNVSLLENEFYKTKILGENIDVISSLIENINIKFKYNLNLSEEVEYAYSYKIIATTELKEKSKSNLIYSDEGTILNKETTEKSSNKLEIVEEMNVDYNYYNDKINKLIDEYKLENTESELSLTMQLTITNKATGERINKETNVMTIVIPLTNKTVEITVNENIKDSHGELIIQENETSKSYLILGIAFLIIGILFLVSLIRYILKTRGAEKIYESDLKKILFDYKSYIQKINTQINYSDYKIIRVDTFNELMQMREDVQAPILMYTENNNYKTIFMMIKENILFTYILSARGIKNQLIEESKKKKDKKGKD